ncbi:hypothetical protein EDC04DRAFT_501567 [Pisolithus marmoratus]|nr:hypothetical protein EDC04DRAFT_501567 [Pisolithus marmoratus]
MAGTSPSSTRDCYSARRSSNVLTSAILRPPGVSHYWADALMAEWTSQACLEKHWHLPPSVQPSSNPLGQVQGQIFFIDTFARPLMDVTARVVPEMQRFADQCTANLVSWQKEKARLTRPQ